MFSFSHPFKFIQDPVLVLDESLRRLHNFSDHSEFKNKEKQENLNYVQKYVCSSQNASDPLSRNPEIYLHLPSTEVLSDGPLGQNLSWSCTSALSVHIWSIGNTQMPFALTHSRNVGPFVGLEWDGTYNTPRSSNKKFSPRSLFTDVHS